VRGALDSISKALGYTSLPSSGHSEYATVYGGLQWGLAMIFASALKPELHRVGILAAMLLYAPIVLHRASGTPCAGRQADVCGGWSGNNHAGCVGGDLDGFPGDNLESLAAGVPDCIRWRGYHNTQSAYVSEYVDTA
jgi:hypothetical protein